MRVFHASARWHRPCHASMLKSMEVVSDFDKNTYRSVYTVKIGDVIYVLHCFQKKSKHGIATPKQELDLIKQRLKAAKQLEKERGK